MFIKLIKRELVYFSTFLKNQLQSSSSSCSSNSSSSSSTIGSYRGIGVVRYVSSIKSIEHCLEEMKAKGCNINVLSLVISNNNLCYCLLKNKTIKKIGLINIKKDFYSYEQVNTNTKKRKANFEKENLRYSYDKEESPLSFNIREILTVLKFIKLYSVKEEHNIIGNNNEYIDEENSSKKKKKKNVFTLDQIEKDNDRGKKHELLSTEKFTEILSDEYASEQVTHCDNLKNALGKRKEEWIIGIEKVNEKYEKNRIKEKILSVIVYFLRSIFQCKILFFCPKEARKYFSRKCNSNLNNREETYKYIKNKIKDFPSVDKNDNKMNCLFSDSYVISFYTYRYYMHELVKSNRKIFLYLENEVRKNKSFNNILQTLKKTQDEKYKIDLRDLLKDRIDRIVENESYMLVDKHII
ncbi:conserved Plasmodium protein, unknown function [Plasmodium malariae]|uniref:Uncharacterized protein n=1 Tax=Plasmodium malariae TaxID=5858 RepID=A0A1C3L0M5_PLAMA|nr:conserved Plasmodium protein, unknown function [Plasmodium malariae]